MGMNDLMRIAALSIAGVIVFYCIGYYAGWWG